jgi:hypothetical protein
MRKLKILLTLSGSLLAFACSAELGAYEPDAGEEKQDEKPEIPVEEVVCDEAVPITFEQRKVTPDIMLVVDKSGSMGDPLVQGNFQTKWNVMSSAITALVAGKGDQVKFGLMLFPWGNNCNPGQVRVNPSLNNVSPILNQMNSIYPEGATPTHQSLEQARAYYDANPVNPDGRIVLLATDGLPICSSISQSVSVINSLSQRNIKTYVLGFGFGNVDLSGLSQMAAAGGTGQVYRADSPDQLSFSLDAILGDVTVPSCDFQLQETPANDEDINVEVNGVPLVRDDANGWRYDSLTKTIHLQGAACDSVKQGGANGIAVDLGCEGVIVD